MRTGTRFLIASGLLLLAACTRTVIVQPGPDRGLRGSRPPPRTPPEPETPPPNPPPPQRTIEALIPPGHLPNVGECRVWIPGRVPGRQPRPRSRLCAGIAAVAPAGSWIVYRPTDDRRLVYVRVIDERRPGIVIRHRIFDIDSWELVRDDEVRDEPRQGDRPGQERPRDQRPPEDRRPIVQPPVRDTARPPEPKTPPPEARPPEQRPPLPPPEIIRPVQPPPPEQRPPDAKPPEPRPPEQRPPPPDPKPPEPQPPENKPPEQPAVPSNVTLGIPPGHLPELGECRVWIPRLQPGLQPKPKSRSCDGIASVAPAGSWILYRPSRDRNVVHVRLVDEHRGGVVIRVQIFDIDSQRLVREENP